LKNNSKTEITVRTYYKEDDADVKKILTDSILIFIKGEVKKLCCQNS